MKCVDKMKKCIGFLAMNITDQGAMYFVSFAVVDGDKKRKSIPAK